MRNENEEGKDRNVLQEEQKTAQRVLIRPSAGETPRSPAIGPPPLSPHVTKQPHALLETDRIFSWMVGKYVWAKPQ